MVRAGDIEHRLLGVIIYGTPADYRALVTAGFDPALLRRDRNINAWPVIEWALKLGLPAAAIPVLDSIRSNWAWTFSEARATKWEVATWRQLAMTLAPEGPPDPIPARARKLQALIEARFK
jgi:hypothetical protein